MHACKVTPSTRRDRLAPARDEVAANLSPCAETRSNAAALGRQVAAAANEAWRIRALGPAFHAMAEINVTGWTNWSRTPAAAGKRPGLEARRRMATAGYDVAAGDVAVEELSSAVRQGAGSRGRTCATSSTGCPATASPGRAGPRLGHRHRAVDHRRLDVQSRLQSWYESAFWTAMSCYVSDWSQEVYGDVRKYAVPGAPREARRDALNQYLQHPATLAAAAPSGVAAAKTFVGATYDPLMNAAWQWNSGFGYTHESVEVMQDFVSAQVYAARLPATHASGFPGSRRTSTRCLRASSPRRRTRCSRASPPRSPTRRSRPTARAGPTGATAISPARASRRSGSRSRPGRERARWTRRRRRRPYLRPGRDGHLLDCDVHVLVRGRCCLRVLPRRIAVRLVRLAVDLREPRERSAPLRGARDRPRRQPRSDARHRRLDDRRRRATAAAAARREPTPGGPGTAAHRPARASSSLSAS